MILEKWMHGVKRYLLTSAFPKHFRIVPAATPELLREAGRIRYQVYCKELGYDLSVDPRGREQDGYDVQSRHCLVQHLPSDRYVGCIRLVLADPARPELPLPFEKACANRFYRDIADPGRMDRTLMGEVSRLAVLPTFRRGTGRMERGSSPSPFPAQYRPHVALGLYLGAAAMGLEAGLERVFALMRPNLARHLTGIGIPFEQVSDVVDHYGPRASYQCTPAMLAALPGVLRKLLDEIRSDLSVEACTR